MKGLEIPIPYSIHTHVSCCVNMWCVSEYKAIVQSASGSTAARDNIYTVSESYSGFLFLSGAN